MQYIPAALVLSLAKAYIHKYVIERPDPWPLTWPFKLAQIQIQAFQLITHLGVK